MVFKLHWSIGLDILLAVNKSDIYSKKMYTNKTNKELLFDMGNKDSRFFISQHFPQGSCEVPSWTTRASHSTTGNN